MRTPCTATRLPESVTYASLFLLQHLKARFSAAKGSSGHRLFISAFMLASKIICDDTYSNKSWCIVAQGMFALREINRMECKMCSYLEWQLNVDEYVLQNFIQNVCSPSLPIDWLSIDIFAPDLIFHDAFNVTCWRRRVLVHAMAS